MLVDSYSGRFEIDQLLGTTSATLVAKLKRHFATHGVPQQLMTDGLAGRTVRSAKHLLEKCARDGTDTDAALLSLRNTPSLPITNAMYLSDSTAGDPPAAAAFAPPQRDTGGPELSLQRPVGALTSVARGM